MDTCFLPLLAYQLKLSNFLSLITLGFYLPVAANKLAKYLCGHTKICIDEAEVSGT